MDAMVHYPQVGRLLEGTVDRVKAKLGSTPMRLAHHIDVTVPHIYCCIPTYGPSLFRIPTYGCPSATFPLTGPPA